jgi:xanthine dehydrogenase accessory factor
MSTFYQQLQELLDAGLTVAVATITQTKGSTPRGVGTKMIVHPYGKHVGTVGGGCGEADVIRAGLDVIDDGQPRTVVVDLTEELSMQSLGVCGGILDVFVERWAASDGGSGSASGSASEGTSDWASEKAGDNAAPGGEDPLAAGSRAAASL